MKWLLPPAILLSTPLLFFFCGCGGGNTGSGNSVSPPSFSIQASPATFNLSPNAAAQVNVALNPANGFNGNVTVSWSGLPIGVTASVSSFLTLTNPQTTITLTAGPNVRDGNYTLTFQGSSGSLSGGATATLTIIGGWPAVGSLPANRTNFVATYDTPTSMVYDSAHASLYVALPDTARVEVINPATNQVVKEIGVPDARSLSLSPDGSRILVTGITQGVVWIDTATQQITQRATLPTYLLPCGCASEPVWPVDAMLMSNGNVLLPGVQAPFITGTLEWNPSAGRLTLVPNAGGNVGVRSADGTKALIVDTETFMGGEVSLYESASDSVVASLSFTDTTFAAAANPTGTQFALAVNNEAISFLDSNLKTLGRSPVGGLVTGMLYSADGSTLYIVSTLGNQPTISSINTTTFQVIGQAPAYASNIADYTRDPPLIVETPMAVDPTGLIFGSADHGVALDDSAGFVNFGSTPADPIWAIIATPNEGSPTSSTNVAVTTQFFSAVPDVWFGTVRGTNESLNSFGQLVVTAQPSTTVGPVNVKIALPDGSEGNIPEAFAYGVSAVQTPILGASPSGGALFNLYGYGFGSDLHSTQVSVGGSSAGLQENTLFNSESSSGYPFPLNHVEAIAPPGTPGVTSMKVTSTSGTASFSNQFRYVQSVTDYSSADTFTFIIYDGTRQRVYLSAGDHVDVFSLASRTFLAPIIPRSLGTARQLKGLALTPDGSKLLISDYQDDSVAIVNPDNPSVGQAVVAVPTAASYEGPTQLVATSTGHAFITIGNSATLTGGGGAVYDLNLSTLQITAVQNIDIPLLQISGNFLAASRDGSRVFLAVPGDSGNPVATWSASAGTWAAGRSNTAIADATASGDGNIFASGGDGPGGAFGYIFLVATFFDSNANLIGRTGLPEYLGASRASLGIKLNDSGSLLYEPVAIWTGGESASYLANGVDIVDVQQNSLVERVMLTELLPTYGQGGMALDLTGQNIFLITNAGLTVITLDDVPLSIGSVTPNAGPAGTTVSIRGSGFVQGTTATFNGSPGSVTYVDADTLQAAIPGSATHSVSITLKNPDGTAYTLSDAFDAN